MSFLLPAGPLLGLGEGGPQFDRRGVDRSHAQRPDGRAAIASHARRPRADPVARRHRRLGRSTSISRSARSTSPGDRRRKFTPPAGRQPPHRYLFVVVARAIPAVIMREYARITGLPEMPALWTFGYQQSHRTLAGPTRVMWVARTIREKKLPCDALIYLGTDSRRQDGTPTTASSPGTEELPRSEGDDRRAARQHFKVVLHIVIEGRTHDRHRERSVHGGTPLPTGPHTRQPVAARPAGRLLLAGAQAALRSRHRRLVAGPGRRPRRAVAAGAHPHVLGRHAAVAAERAAVRAASQRLRRACSATARFSGRATCTRRGRR